MEPNLHLRKSELESELDKLQTVVPFLQEIVDEGTKGAFEKAKMLLKKAGDDIALHQSTISKSQLQTQNEGLGASCVGSMTVDLENLTPLSTEQGLTLAVPGTNQHQGSPRSPSVSPSPSFTSIIEIPDSVGASAVFGMFGVASMTHFPVSEEEPPMKASKRKRGRSAKSAASSEPLGIVDRSASEVAPQPAAQIAGDSSLPSPKLSKLEHNSDSSTAAEKKAAITTLPTSRNIFDLQVGNSILFYVENDDEYAFGIPSVDGQSYTPSKQCRLYMCQLTKAPGHVRAKKGPEQVIITGKYYLNSSRVLTQPLELESPDTNPWETKIPVSSVAWIFEREDTGQKFTETLAAVPSETVAKIAKYLRQSEENATQPAS